MIPAELPRLWGFSIREARPDDATAVAGFNSALASETEGKSLDPNILRRGVEAALADPERLRYWVAVDDKTGVVIGQSAVTREWSDWRNGWCWWFQSVFVDSEHRQRGVFRALYLAIRDAARSSPDVIGLRLYVEAENHRAKRTYQALGMVPGGYEVFEELWPDRFGIVVDRG